MPLTFGGNLRIRHSEHKLGFAIALFILGYLAPLHVQLLITLWLTLWVVGYARIPAAVYFKLLALPVSFLLLSLPALVIEVSLTTDIANADNVLGMPIGPVYLYLSQQGLDRARTVLTRSIALTSCMYFILLTVPFVEIVRVLRRVGCPSLLTELLSLMYRFIFVLTETAAELLTAQQSRLGYCNWRSLM